MKRLTKRFFVLCVIAFVGCRSFSTAPRQQRGRHVSWAAAKQVRIDKFLQNLDTHKIGSIFFVGGDLRKLPEKRITLPKGESDFTELLDRLASQTDLNWVFVNEAFLLYETEELRRRFAKTPAAPLKEEINHRWGKELDLVNCCDWPIHLFVTAMRQNGIDIKLSSVPPGTEIFGQSSWGYIYPLRDSVSKLSTVALLDWLCNSAELTYEISGDTVVLTKRTEAREGE